MKTPLIDVRLNTVKTAILIEDIRTFCVDKAAVKPDVNELEFCKKLEEKISDEIEVEQMFEK